MLMFILYEVSMPVFANVKASWVNFCCFKVYYMNTLTGLRLTAWLKFESLIIIFCFILKCNSNCATTKAKWKTGEATKLALLPMLNENSSLWKNDDI